MSAVLTTQSDLIRSLSPSLEISPNDKMFKDNKRHYFGVGRSAIMLIASAMSARTQFRCSENGPSNILDFGCGHGRVARFMRAAFPDARLEVTDFNKDGMRFCIDRLGAHDMGAEIPTNLYDLIWLGSVFTHLSEDVTRSLIKQLKAALREFGVLVFTTHGRVPLATVRAFIAGGCEATCYDLQKQQAGTMLEDFNRTGFGYTDYPGRKGYGITVAGLCWYISATLDSDTMLIGAQERGWDTHQDVLAFMRADQKKLERGNLYFSSPLP